MSTNLQSTTQTIDCLYFNKISHSQLNAQTTESASELSMHFGKPWGVSWAMAVSALQQLTFKARAAGCVIDLVAVQPFDKYDGTEVYWSAMYSPSMIDGVILAELKRVFKAALAEKPTCTEWTLTLNLIPERVISRGFEEHEYHEDLTNENVLALQHTIDHINQKSADFQISRVVAMPDYDPFRLAS